MEAEKILSRLKGKERDFFFSFLEAESIGFESIVNLQSLQDIIKGLKDRYEAIESSKLIKKWIDLIDKQDRISGVWKTKKVIKSKITIEGKNDNEVKNIIRKQKKIVSIIKILENKILPEVKIYNQLSLTKTKVNKKDTIINQIPKEYEKDIQLIREKVKQQFSIKAKPQINHICRIIANQYETIKSENRHTDKPTSNKIKPKIILKSKDLFQLCISCIPEIKEAYTIHQLLNSFSKGCL